MPNTVTSPNMNIVVPVNLTDPSPDWGQRIQTALQTTVDAHDHSPGKGVQVTPAGLNVNADLSFNGTGGAGGPYNAISARSARFVSQGAPLALGSDIGCVYVSNGELWYNDTSSRQVQLTSVGAVKSSPQVLAPKDVTTSYTILSTDPYQLFICHSGTAATAIALPQSSLIAQGRVYYFVDRDGNGAVNALTISPNGADLINGVNAAVTIPVNFGLVIVELVVNGQWVVQTVQPAPVYGASAVGLSTGTTTLTAAQLRANVIQFSGTLTGNVTVVFPNAPGSFTCDFSQVVMGANTVAVKSGTATSFAMTNAFIGSTVTSTQITFVITYGGNTVRIKA